MIPNWIRTGSQGNIDIDERVALYNHVVETKPEKVFEIATWRGGGSTYFISSAPDTNGFGHLWTVEIIEKAFNVAKSLYSAGGEMECLSKYITMHLGDGMVIFPPILKEHGPIDMAFIDAGFNHEHESAEMQVKQYEMIRPHIRVGGTLLFHDWTLDKSVLTRPIMENDKDFCLINLVNRLAIFVRTSRDD